jgi:hypothetical protein
MSYVALPLRKLASLKDQLANYGMLFHQMLDVTNLFRSQRRVDKPRYGSGDF